MTESRLIKIVEDWRGTRGGEYYYVKEGNKLIRMIEYAKSPPREIYESRRGRTIEYYVSVEELRGKTIYLFHFTNKGYFDAYKGTVDAFLNPDPRFPDVLPNYALMQKVSPYEFYELNFEVEDSELFNVLEDLKKYYITMINDLNNYKNRMGFEILFIGRAMRTPILLINPYAGIMECMVLQSDKARLKCLEKPLAWIYQLWVMKLICDALGIQEFVKDPNEERPSWQIEQGRPYPTFIGRSGTEYFTFWFEFQPHKWAHLAGMFFRERVSVRPDIVVARGKYNSAEELNGNPIDLIVEVKNTDFTYWESDVNTQIPTYIDIYKPKAFILASFKSIPNSIKHKLNSQGIITVDGLRPDNIVMQEFMKFVRKALLH